MKGINQAPVGLMTWAMGRLLPKLVDFLKQEHNLQTTSMKKNLLESLERQLRTMDRIQFKMSQEKQDQLDLHNSHYWAIDAWDLSYDIEDTIDNLLLLCVEDGLEPKDSVMETLDGIKARVKNLVASNSPAGDFVATTSSSTIVDPCIEDGFKEVSQLIGIHELTGEVKTMMSSSHELKTVSICGPGGMGKTTLAKAVYDSIKGDFQCSAFVSLGLQPDMKKALRDILIDLAKERYSDLNRAILDETQLIDELRHFLKNKRFLIVVDDIRDMQSWKTIECALIDSGCGSRIITTTCILDVAETSGEVLKLMPLSIDGSKELFYTTLCGRKGTITFDPLDEQSTKYILKACGGVPLAIITIASLLAGKPQEEWTKVYKSIGFGQEDNKGAENTRKIILAGKPQEEWTKVYKSIGSGQEDNKGAENTRKIIQFSYYDLPSHLKTCLLYFSIFPNDYIIDKDMLVWRWVAEGFVHEEQGESLFKAGERYLYELISRSMIQLVENEDTNICGCRVHDMVLDLIRFVAKEESFVTILGWDDHGDEHLSYQSNVHTIAVHNRVLEKQDLTQMLKPKVRSFNGTGCGISSVMSLLSCFQVLRVLSLEGCWLTSEGRYGLKKLAGLLHLRYIGIHGMDIGVLPMEIGDLRFLQTLDLMDNIKVLPHSVTQLRQLKCLRCLGSRLLELPEGMGNLTLLEELRLGRVNKSPNLAKELGNMTELRVIHIIFSIGIFDGKWEDILMESLSKLQKIEELELLCDGLPRSHAFCRYVIGKSEFPRLRYLRMNTWVMYQLGAMPSLKSIDLSIHLMGAFNRASFDFHKLSFLHLLEKARVAIICSWRAKTEDADEAEAALRRVFHSHPNRPKLILNNRSAGWYTDDEKRSLGLHGYRVAPEVMSLEFLKNITNDFSKERELGSGTFGKVYKGVQNDKEIAVKLLHRTQRHDYEEEFRKEFENLRRLKHPNIVQLLGYCYEIKCEFVAYEGRHIFADNIYRALCFEYMFHGSLQGHLRDEFHGMDWQTRYKIIKGTCEGLKYLHEGLESPMYHLDLKPGNILLDNNMVPKLADFGLSKLVCDNQTQSTTSFVGTIKYCPPEYIEQKYVNNKFDIFSLGVVMIEIIAGSEGYRKTAEMLSQEFIDHVQENWRKRLQATPGYNCNSIIIYECHQVKRCIEIALDCVLPDRKQRPNIGDITSWLNETENDTEMLATTFYNLTKRDMTQCYGNI